MKTIKAALVPALVVTLLLTAMLVGFFHGHLAQSQPAPSFGVIEVTPAKVVGLYLVIVIVLSLFNKHFGVADGVVTSEKVVVNGQTFQTLHSLKPGASFQLVEVLKVNSSDQSVIARLKSSNGRQADFWLSHQQATWVQPTASYGQPDRATATHIIGNDVKMVLVAKNPSIKGDFILVPQDEKIGVVKTLQGPSAEQLAEMAAAVKSQDEALEAATRRGNHSPSPA